MEQEISDNDEAEWAVPSQETFDRVVMTALDDFSDTRPDIIHALAHSSTGWNTGVGLLVFHTAEMSPVDDFRSTLMTPAPLPASLPSPNSLS